MFDVSQIAKRYFDIRLTVEDNGGEIHKVDLKVEPPTVKQLRKLTSVSADDEATAMTDLRDAVRDILSKNKTGYKVPEAYVDSLDFDQLTGILVAYMQWVSEEKKAKN